MSEGANSYLQDDEFDEQSEGTQKSGPMGYLLAGLFFFLVYAALKQGTYFVAFLSFLGGCLSVPPIRDGFCDGGEISQRGKSWLNRGLVLLFPVCLFMWGYAAVEAKSAAKAEKEKKAQAEYELRRRVLDRISDKCAAIELRVIGAEKLLAKERDARILEEGLNRTKEELKECERAAEREIRGS